MKRKKHKTLPGCLLAVILAAGIVCAGAAGCKAGEKLPDKAREAVQNISGRSLPYEEVTIEESSVAHGFYYNQLASGEEQTVYKEILQGIRENKEEIYLHFTDGARANAIFQNVLDDYPEIFWCDGNATSTAFAEVLLQEAHVVLRPNYVYEGSEKERRIGEVEAAADACLQQIPAEASDYEKIRQVYEYLISTVDYVPDAPDNQNLYSALVGKASVCAGYAKSNQYLLEKLGISCAYVTGKATNESGITEDHAWNIVTCGGESYFVDVTWGDPVFQQEAEGAASPVPLSYDYLCCSQAELSRTHKLTEGYDYPPCESEALNYYRMNGMYYETFDREQMQAAMFRSIEAGEACTIFKLGDPAVFAETREAMQAGLMEEGARYLGSLYGLGEIRYSYMEEPSLQKFIVCWYYD